MVLLAIGVAGGGLLASHGYLRARGQKIGRQLMEQYKTVESTLWEAAAKHMKIKTKPKPDYSFTANIFKKSADTLKVMLNLLPVGLALAIAMKLADGTGEPPSPVLDTELKEMNKEESKSDDNVKFGSYLL